MSGEVLARNSTPPTDTNTTHPPLPTPPFVTVSGIPNFRSLGGYAIPPTTRTSPQTGRPLRTRSDFIFRCAQPSGITPSGVTTVNDLGITTFYDLRSGPELRKLAAVTPIGEIPGTMRVFAPVYRDEDYSPEKLAVKYKDYVHKGGPEGFVRAYTDILRHAAEGSNSSPPSSSYRTVFEHIRDRPNEGLVIHCTAGKDRTGILCALILRLAGVSDDDIASEYALTEKGLGAWRFEIIDRLLADVKTAESDREGIENMVGSKRENMLAVLEMVDTEFGGAEGYLKDRLGFGDADLQTIRDNIVEEGEGFVKLF